MPTDNTPTAAALFAAALAYLDERIAWLEHERRELVEAECRRLEVERATRAVDRRRDSHTS